MREMYFWFIFILIMSIKVFFPVNIYQLHNGKNLPRQNKFLKDPKHFTAQEEPQKISRVSSEIYTEYTLDFSY